MVYTVERFGQVKVYSCSVLILVYIFQYSFVNIGNSVRSRMPTAEAKLVITEDRIRFNKLIESIICKFFDKFG